MNAIILSVGDELVLGQTVDTNSAWISQQLAAVGCDIAAHMTVPDDQRLIEQAIRDSLWWCEVVLISGGIGPTEDDLTRQALSMVMEVPLELNRKWLEHLEAFFEKLGRKMPETNRIQAMIPRGAKMIENTCGTAAGVDAVIDWHEVNRPADPQLVSDEYMKQMFGETELAALKMREVERRLALARVREIIRRRGGELIDKTRIFVMPGVPKEMKAMFTRDVLPHITERSGGAVILSRTLHTFGAGESTVAEKLGVLMTRTRNPSVGTTVSQGIVSLRLNARFASKDEAQKQLEETETACRAALGDLIFGSEEQTLPTIVATSLAASRKTVATAESCTGGLLAKMLTDIPGSSDYFQQGWITYANSAKINRLGVSENIINCHGAVSEPVVEAMASAARRLANADFALAISGVAGPTGGTAAKPVGAVCIALASRHATDKLLSAVQVRTFQFTGDREMIRDRAAKMALSMLRFALMDKPMPF